MTLRYIVEQKHLKTELWRVRLLIHFYLGEKWLQVRICVGSWAEVSSCQVNADMDI